MTNRNLRNNGPVSYDVSLTRFSDHPIYLTVAEGKVAETRELVDGRLIADFDADGKLIGLELL